MKPINCKDKVVANPLFDGVLDSSIKVLCPKGCAEQAQFPVYGKTSFSSKSSICRAAVLSGIIKDDTGGEIFVNIGKP